MVSVRGRAAGAAPSHWRSTAVLPGLSCRGRIVVACLPYGLLRPVDFGGKSLKLPTQGDRLLPQRSDIGVYSVVVENVGAASLADK